MEPRSRKTMSFSAFILFVAIITQYDLEGGIITKEEMIICKALNKCQKHNVQMYIKQHHAKGSYVSCLICERESGEPTGFDAQDMDTINELITNSLKHKE